MSLTRLFRTQGLRTIIWLCVVAAVGHRWLLQVEAADRHLGFDITNASVPIAAIERGGPAKDGIPALTDPRVIASADAHFIQDTDRVVGLVLNGDARAYPIKILNWHEVANDRIGGTPVAVTWCPLCGTAMVFSAGSVEERLILGVSGLLYNSDVLLYDKATESLWSQVYGRAISGPRLGEELQLIPAVHTTWGDWRSSHPATDILDIDTGYNRDYSRDPYADYASSAELYFAVNNVDSSYHPKAWVTGISRNGESKAWPFEELEKARGIPINDFFAGEPVTVNFAATSRSVTITGKDGKLIPSTTAFWFAWHAFYPDSSVYRHSP